MQTAWLKNALAKPCADVSFSNGKTGFQIYGPHVKIPYHATSFRRKIPIIIGSGFWQVATDERSDHMAPYEKLEGSHPRKPEFPNGSLCAHPFAQAADYWRGLGNEPSFGHRPERPAGRCPRPPLATGRG